MPLRKPASHALRFFSVLQKINSGPLSRSSSPRPKHNSLQSVFTKESLPPKRPYTNSHDQSQFFVQKQHQSQNYLRSHHSCVIQISSPTKILAKQLSPSVTVWPTFCRTRHSKTFYSTWHVIFSFIPETWINFGWGRLVKWLTVASMTFLIVPRVSYDQRLSLRRIQLDTDPPPRVLVPWNQVTQRLKQAVSSSPTKTPIHVTRTEIAQDKTPVVKIHFSTHPSADLFSVFATLLSGLPADDLKMSFFSSGSTSPQGNSTSSDVLTNDGNNMKNSRSSDSKSIVPPSSSSSPSSNVNSSSDSQLSIVVSNVASSTTFFVNKLDKFSAYAFLPQLGPFMPEISFEKYDQSFDIYELDAIIDAYELAQLPRKPVRTDQEISNDPDASNNTQNRSSASSNASSTSTISPGAMTPSQRKSVQDVRRKSAIEKLEKLGVHVYDVNTSHSESASNNTDLSEPLDWNDLAGYADVKAKLEETLTFAIKHPDIYQAIVEGTRIRHQSNLPKAVLFEGPPGCGKTTAAKILAQRAGVPFIHVPLEVIVSKWFGDSERRLAHILEAANELDDASLIFLDEVDSLGASRDQGDTQGVSRRLLSVLLRHVDGIDGQKRSILIAATNRKDDLDAALMSRFDIVLTFPLPDLDARSGMFAMYAKQLSKRDIQKLALASEGFSGRNILDICEEVERMWARLVIQEKVPKTKLPSFKDYLKVIEERQQQQQHSH